MKYSLAIDVLALLSVCMILNVSAVMAETESNYPYADIEAMKKESTSGSDADNNLLKQNSKNAVNASNQKKRSIKMIVGGQSEDGVAKQVNVSVDD